MTLAMIGIHFARLLLEDTRFGLGTRRPKKTSAVWDTLEGEAHEWQEALEMARAAINSRDIRRAVWIGHRVLLALLHDRGAIIFEGWKTNSAYLQECASSHPWYTTLQRMNDIHEQVVYGHRDVSLTQINGLLELVARHGAEGAYER